MQLPTCQVVLRSSGELVRINVTDRDTKLHADPEPEARYDGPTIEEFVGAGYQPSAYPPNGYAERQSPGLELWKRNGSLEPLERAPERRTHPIVKVNLKTALKFIADEKNAAALAEAAEIEASYDGGRAKVLDAIMSRLAEIAKSKEK